MPFVFRSLIRLRYACELTVFVFRCDYISIKQSYSRVIRVFYENFVVQQCAVLQHILISLLSHNVFSLTVTKCARYRILYFSYSHSVLRTAQRGVVSRMSLWNPRARCFPSATRCRRFNSNLKSFSCLETTIYR